MQHHPRVWITPVEVHMQQGLRRWPAVIERFTMDVDTHDIPLGEFALVPAGYRDGNAAIGQPRREITAGGRHQALAIQLPTGVDQFLR